MTSTVVCKLAGALVLTAAALAAVLLAGCDDEDRAALRDKAHAAIIQYAETGGADKAAEYIDQLVADGKLGAANAAKIKAAIPLGMDRLKATLDATSNQED